MPRGGYVLPGIIDAHTHIGVYEEGIGFEGAGRQRMTNPPRLLILSGAPGMPLTRRTWPCRRQGRRRFTSSCRVPGSANVIGGQYCHAKIRGRGEDDMSYPCTPWFESRLGEKPQAGGI